jgi:hypothetical protein
VLSKEHGILLAPMLGVIYAARRWLGRDVLDRNTRNAHALLFLVMCLSVLGYTAYRESIMRLFFDQWFLAWTVNPVARAAGADRILVPVSVIGRYVELLLCPWRLSPDYGANVTDYRIRWHEPYVYLGLIAIATWAIALFYNLRRRHVAPVICLLCMAGAYFLISNFIMIIGIIMGDRLIYLTSVFFVILMSMALARLKPRMLLPVMIVLLTLASVKTVNQAWRWNDALRLFSLSRAEFPRSAYLYVLEAEERMELGGPEQLALAERILAQGRQVEPTFPNVWKKSADLARRLGKPDEAQRFAYWGFHLDENPPHMPPRPFRRRVRTENPEP